MADDSGDKYKPSPPKNTRNFDEWTFSAVILALTGTAQVDLDRAVSAITWIELGDKTVDVDIPADSLVGQLYYTAYGKLFYAAKVKMSTDAQAWDDLVDSVNKDVEGLRDGKHGELDLDSMRDFAQLVGSLGQSFRRWQGEFTAWSTLLGGGENAPISGTVAEFMQRKMAYFADTFGQFADQLIGPTGSGGVAAAAVDAWIKMMTMTKIVSGLWDLVYPNSALKNMPRAVSAQLDEKLWDYLVAAGLIRGQPNFWLDGNKQLTTWWKPGVGFRPPELVTTVVKGKPNPKVDIPKVKALLAAYPEGGLQSPIPWKKNNDRIVDNTQALLKVLREGVTPSLRATDESYTFLARAFQPLWSEATPPGADESAAGPGSDVPGPMSDLFGPLSNMFAPMSDLFGPLSNMFGPMSDLFGPLSNMFAPMSDMFAPMSDLFGGAASVPPGLGVLSDAPNALDLGAGPGGPTGTDVGRLGGAEDPLNGAFATPSTDLGNALPSAGGASGQNSLLPGDSIPGLGTAGLPVTGSALPDVGVGSPLLPAASGPLLGREGELVTPDGQPILGPNGEILGPDGQPLLGPNGELLGPGQVPILGQNGELLGPGGTSLLGPNGEILGPGGTPVLGPGGELLGPDGTPIPDVNGEPIRIPAAGGGLPPLDLPGGDITSRIPLPTAGGPPTDVSGLLDPSRMGIDGTAGLDLPGGNGLPGGPGAAGQAVDSNGVPVSGTGAGMPYMPMMPGGGMGAGNQNRGGERERQTWLSEDEKVWGTENGRGAGVIGRPDSEEEVVGPDDLIVPLGPVRTPAAGTRAAQAAKTAADAPDGQPAEEQAGAGADDG